MMKIKISLFRIKVYIGYSFIFFFRRFKYCSGFEEM